MNSVCRRVCLVVALSCIFLSTHFAFGQNAGQDIFQKIEGEHFTILYDPSADIAALVQSLNVNANDQLLAGGTTANDASVEGQLARGVETIFLRACDILDMPLYSFKGTIEICLHREQIERIYKELLQADLPAYSSSFYVHDQKTIYITAESFKKEVLGHEIGHAIISNYFVVQPSVKIQEVLSGYIEYQLRKP